MANYSLLFSVTIDHSYFADGKVPDLLIEPDSATQKLLVGLNFIFRQTDEGFTVSYDTSSYQENQLSAYEGKKLSFFIRSLDSCFLQYTLLPPYTNNSVFYFTNATHSSNKNNPGSTLPLAAETIVGNKDLFQLIPSSLTTTQQKTKPVLKDLFNNTIIPLPGNNINCNYTNLDGAYTLNEPPNKTALYASIAAYKAKPLVVAEFYLVLNKTGKSYSVFENGKIIPKEFGISFESRSAKWRYYVVNKTNTKFDNLSITSNNKKIAFANKGDVTAQNYPASVIISKSALKMQQYPGSEVSLTIRNGNGNTVLENIILPSAESLKTENKINFIDTYIYI